MIGIEQLIDATKRICSILEAKHQKFDYSKTMSGSKKLTSDRQRMLYEILEAT